MALEIIGLYAAGTGGTEDAIRQFDIPQDGVIRGIDWDFSAILDAEEVVEAELSFIATNQLATNEVRGRVSSVSLRAAQITAVGIAVAAIQKWVGPFELMVAGGERMFIHVAATAGVASVTRMSIHFDGGAVVTRRSARR